MTIQRIAWTALCLALAPAGAFAGEKQQTDMVLPPAGYSRDFCHVGVPPSPPSAFFLPGVSKGKAKFDDKCKIQVQLKKTAGLPLGDGIAGSGDEVWCLIHFFDGIAGPCGSFMVNGEVLGAAGKEKVKINVKGGNDYPGLCPAAPGLAFHVTHIECYEPDPLYSTFLSCLGTGGAHVPSLIDPSHAVCVGAGSYVPPPTTPVLAVQGVLF